ncbi:MAG: putative OPT family oligopeptide transporter [Chlamydiales bacterium]|jgi:putative OPT family oligopeptide transporter
MATTIRRGPYPELTWPAVIVGWLIGAIIAVSMGYAALILGFSIEGSELAAILGWGILRGVMRRTSIVENNINQSLASAVNAASSGMMFSVPALFILSDKYEGLTDFSHVIMVLCCITGAVIGLSFVIPLRKQMIDFNRLAYPGGIATAAILKSPGAGMKKAMLMIGAAVFSGVVRFWVLKYSDDASPHIGGENFELGAMLGLRPYLNLTFYLSVMTIGVGFLSGKGGLWFGAGGFLCYWLLAPLLAQFAGPDVTAIVDGGPGPLRSDLFRPAGIGMLIGAAVGSIVFAAPMIKSAIQSMQKASDNAEGATSDEMPIKFLYAGVVGGGLALTILCMFTVPDMTIGKGIMMSLLGILWVWVAGVIVAECVGRTNWSPLSGMTLIAVTILTVIASGLAESQQIIAAVMMGAAICVAISQASDMMLDLKAGYLVGAKPKMQAYAQFLGTWLGPIIVMALIVLLDKSHGLGSDALPAPQGTALASVIEGIVGGDVPTYRYGGGAGLGLLFALSGLGGIGVLVGLGFYMPFSIVLTYTIGNFLRIGADKALGKSWVEDAGIPLAAGLIVGEALVGVGDAMYIVFQSTGGA